MTAKIVSALFFKNMKILLLSFSLLIFFTGLCKDELLLQPSIGAKLDQTSDWSALFPEIAGCERVIQPLTQNGEVFKQIAIYERENYKDNQNENYVGCGSIALRFEPSTRKTARENSTIEDFPLRQRLRIKDFDAYHSSPLCGNDDWRGSTSVYFDDDKVLIASANRWTDKILEFAQNADYELMKKSMNKIVKERNRRK